jgi:tetratricopeptide (TPR) repeat protein
MSKTVKKQGSYVKQKACWVKLFSLTQNSSRATGLDFTQQNITVTLPEKEVTMQKAPNAEAYIEEQRRAIASNPDCGTSHYNLAVALLGQGKIEEGEKSLMTAIECSPGLAEAYVQMGGIRLKRGDLDGCLDWNRRAVKMKPSFSEGWGNIGFVLLQQGELEGAIKALKKATAFNFRFIQAFATLANAYLMNGQIKESIETNLKALELSPEFAVAHNNLAIAYLEDGQTALAVEHADKAMELGYQVAPEILKELEPHRS